MLLCTRKRRAERNTDRCQTVFELIFLRLRIGWGRVRDYFLGYILCVVTSLRFPVCVLLLLLFFVVFYTFLRVVTSLHIPVCGFSLHIPGGDYFFTNSCARLSLYTWQHRGDKEMEGRREPGGGGRDWGKESNKDININTKSASRVLQNVKKCRWTNQTHTCLMPLSFSEAIMINNNNGANWW